MRGLWSALLFVVVLFAGLVALPDAANAAPPDAANEAEGATDPSTDQSPVPVPVPSEKAMQYYRSGNLLWGFRQIWGLLIPFLILWLGISAKMRNWAAKAVKERWFLTIVGFWILYTLCTWVIDLPLDYYAGYVRPHDYGLSEQAFSKWFGDSLKGLILGLIFGSMFIWIPFLLLKKSPNRWWIYTSLVFIPLAFVMMVVAPLWISPLFNEFGPMADKALEAKILAMADRAGIEGGRVFEVDKSVDTKTVNAYVAGLGGTKRIVLWDTIIAQLSERQLLVVMGHEMGHYVLGHIRNGMIMVAFTIPTMLCIAHYSAKGIIRRYKDRFGFDSLSDVAALPLIAIIVSVIGFIASPGFMAMTRYQEHESDRFALEMTHDNHACAGAFATLQEQNLGNPRPGLLFKLFRASHPPLGERIDFCNEYKPWETGGEQRYTELFKE
jgi:Zn-dependent protease with chaperone function